MTICASGEISLGGSTVGRSVNIEIGAGNTATITMDQANVRSLPNVTTAGSQISMNCFYGKSSGLALGSVYCGGYYTGVIDIGGGVCYYMVVSPNATGCADGCLWKTTRTSTTGTSSLVDGYSNTWGPMNNATHPAGNFTATRSINGYSDWYMASRDETGIMYTNKGSMPVGEGYPTENYWSSTEVNAVCACARGFSSGGAATAVKTSNQYRVRALRRVRI